MYDLLLYSLHYGLSQDMEYIPVLYSGTLFIHLTYSPWHPPIPSSGTIPPPGSLPLGNRSSVLYVWESVSVP